MVPQWLKWAREIQALAQTGNTYSLNNYQQQRYNRLNEIAAEIISAHTEIETKNLIESFQSQVGYATPKLDVRSAAFKNNKLLMVQERIDGGWCLPGGWVDVGDMPSYAAERETLEESGFKVKAKRLIGVYDSNRIEPLNLYHSYKLVFFAEIIGGKSHTSDETTKVSFFGERELPTKLSGSRTTNQHIKDAFSALKDSTRLAVFD